MWLKIFCSKKHLLLLIIKQQQQIMADLSKLNDAVTTLNTTIGQAVTIIESGTDQAAIDTITSSVNTANSTLAAAITAATPTPPTP